MGKIHLTNREQKIILDVVKADDFISQHFYFTGGTALSSCYLNHRYSEDLDFFTTEKFDQQVVFEIVERWSKKHNFTIRSARFVEVVYIFNLLFKNGEVLKVDFATYAHKQIEKPKIVEGVAIDSLTDIAVNKLLTVSQRSEIKDFVDLYFLLKKFSIWDLRYGVKIKFNVDIEPLLLAADFLKVENFDVMPRMIKPLTLEELKSFFREKAKEIGAKAVE